MKKVIFTVAIILGGLSTYANSSFPMNQTEAVVISIQEEYKEVKISELPQAVKDAVAAQFGTATLTKASVNAKEEYKLELTIDQGEYSVYANKDGSWIEKK